MHLMVQFYQPPTPSFPSAGNDKSAASRQVETLALVDSDDTHVREHVYDTNTYSLDFVYASEYYIFKCNGANFNVIATPSNLEVD